MGSIKKFLFSSCIALIIWTTNTPVAMAAAVRLSPMHIYTWAHKKDTTHLAQYQRYINLKDQDDNTALCIAQQKDDRDAYSLLLDYGASTKVSCHDNNNAVCAIIAGEKLKVSPAGWALIGAGAVTAGALLIHDGGDKDSHCPAGFKKGLKDCSNEHHPEGWEYVSGGQSDHKPCGTCVPKQCQIGYTDCAPAIKGFVLNQEESGSYAGDFACYNCLYTCDDGYYNSESSCTSNGYICDVVEYKGVKCWWRTGSEQCPIDYPNESPCETGIGFINNQTSKVVGFRTCYGCNYQCDTDNNWQPGNCPFGLTCDTIELPNGGGLCHKTTGCAAEFPFTSKQECEVGGWICEESFEGSGCWHRTKPKGCPQTYTQGLKDCNAQPHPEGWTYTSSGVSGDEVWQVRRKALSSRLQNRLSKY